MVLVAGVDSSTQSCKVVIRDATTGALVRSGQAAHPDGTEVDPRHWWDALQRAVELAGGLADVSAFAVGGQQHGMVALDATGAVIRPALLWNDTRSAAAAEQLITDLSDGSGNLSGQEAWARRTGTVPVASITATKLRWLADAEPEAAARVAAVALPHDWLTWMLQGGPEAGLEALVTDRSDASGTGYFDTARGVYDRDLLDLALRQPHSSVVLPRVLAPTERAGVTAAVGAVPAGIVLGPGCGDNAGAALGLGMGVGDVSLSIGTSGVVAAVTGTATADPSGTIAGFADATGAFLPLAVTLNCAQVMDRTAGVLGVGLKEFDALALAAAPGAGGVTMVPFFAGERTPNLPHSTASLVGMTAANFTRENVARAAIESLLCLLADGLDRFREAGITADRLLLTGGGARSGAVQQIATEVFQAPITVPEPGEYVANGAARQAAGVLADEFPDWPVGGHEVACNGSSSEARVHYAQRTHLYAPRG